MEKAQFYTFVGRFNGFGLFESQPTLVRLKLREDLTIKYSYQ